jgi:hypothetical protein
LRRYVAATGSYDFPVGNTDAYELANMSITGGNTASYFTAYFSNPTNATGTGLPLFESVNWDALVNCGGTAPTVGNVNGGVWTFTPNAGTASYTMTLYGRNYDNAGSTSYNVLKRTTAGPGPWFFDGTYGTSSNSGTLITCSRTGMSGFSQFAIGRSTTPLPIELLAFDVTCTNYIAKISWATASETNNHHFTLERSCDDMNHFATIATIQGAGNSSSLKTYSFTDTDFPGDVCYYRLSQTDNDGITTQFNVVAASCELNTGFNFSAAYPNPVSHELNVLFTDNDNEHVQIAITNVLGQQFYTKEIVCEKGLNTVTLDLSNYSSGVYFLELTNGKKSFNKKVIKSY